MNSKIDWTGLVSAMAHIRESGRKYPQIDVDLPSGFRIQLRLDKHWQVWINEWNDAKADRTGLAVISCDGKTMRALGAKNLQEPEKTELRAFCRALAEDPKEALAAAGKRLGFCCLCSRPLSNDESVERGMGPTCAKRAGWA